MLRRGAAHRNICNKYTEKADKYYGALHLWVTNLAFCYERILRHQAKGMTNIAVRCTLKFYKKDV